MDHNQDKDTEIPADPEIHVVPGVAEIRTDTEVTSTETEKRKDAQVSSNTEARTKTDIPVESKSLKEKDVLTHSDVLLNDEIPTAPDKERKHTGIVYTNSDAQDMVHDVDKTTMRTDNVDEQEHIQDRPDISTFLKPGRLKNLADLITVCRESGVQIYNNKINIPQQEIQRIDELRELGIDPESEKGHRSDHLDPTDPKFQKKVNRRKSVKPLADVIIVCRTQGKQIYNGTPNVPNLDKELQERVDNSEVTNSDHPNGGYGDRSRSSRSKRRSRLHSGYTVATTLSRPTSYLSSTSKSTFSGYVSYFRSISFI